MLFSPACSPRSVAAALVRPTDIKTRSQVMEMGIDKYNEECRSIVMRYSAEWQTIVERLGRWIDFEVRCGCCVGCAWLLVSSCCLLMLGPRLL